MTRRPKNISDFKIKKMAKYTVEYGENFSLKKDFESPNDIASFLLVSVNRVYRHANKDDLKVKGIKYRILKNKMYTLIVAGNEVSSHINLKEIAEITSTSIPFLLSRIIQPTLEEPNIEEPNFEQQTVKNCSTGVTTEILVA